MKNGILVSTMILLALGVGACSHSEKRPAATPQSEPYTAPSSPDMVQPEHLDTSGGQQPTGAGGRPMDQAADDSDLKMTRELRESLMSDEHLSMPARNIEISTEEGKVTLRGSVNSAAERQAVEAKARAIQGVKEIDNELVVAQ